MAFRKGIVVLSLAIMAAVPVYSQTGDGPALHTQQYEPTLQDGRYAVGGFCSFPGLGDRTIFANLLLWTVDNVCQSQFIGLDDKDFDHLQLSFPATIKSATVEGATYDITVAFKVGEGRLMFSVTNVRYSSGSLLMGSGVRLEMYKNTNKDANRRVINDFEKSESTILNEIFDFVAGHDVPVSRWDAMRAGRPVEGMTEEECKCTVGKPSHVWSDGQETQWVIGAFKHVFFKDGVITSIVS